MASSSIRHIIQSIPKAELHLHIEGTLEPDLLFSLARKNKVSLPYPSPEAVKAAYTFNNLQEFLDIYYAGASVLLHEEDFYLLTRAYLQKAHGQNVVHAEMFFDPQTHTSRGIPFDAVMRGINRAREEALREQGTTSLLIMCFLRHLDEVSAIHTLKEAIRWKDSILGVGLDSSEKGNPPSKFRKAFEMARAEGYLTVAHAGEEGPATYIDEALDVLKVDRIDHGNRSVDSPELVRRLHERQMALTMCPLSNLKLKVHTDLSQHPAKRLMEQGVLVTVNSDDPAYFGGYVNENYLALAEALQLTASDIVTLAGNSFKASFLDPAAKNRWLQTLQARFSLVDTNSQLHG